HRVNFRRHGTPLLVLLLIHPAACALRARAADLRSDARSLTVRPVAPPELIREQRRHGMAPRAGAMSPAEQAAVRARLERQRAVHAREGALHEKALRGGASSAASRRPGWRPPAAGAARGRTGFSALAGLPAPGTVDTIRIAFIRVDFLNDRGGSASSGD